MAVYFVQNARTDAVKIGTSADPRARVLRLQTGSADPLALLGSCSGGSKLERELHRRFAPYRLRKGGEWFRGHPALMVAIGKIIETQTAAENAWEAYLRRGPRSRPDFVDIEVRAVESGHRSNVVNTSWDVDGHLLLHIFGEDGSPMKIRAERCVLLGELPRQSARSLR